MIGQYLRHQHRQCFAPIATCPPFSLLEPHACAEPLRTTDAPLNVSARLQSREIFPRHGGNHGAQKMRQFVYSRFKPLKACRDEGSIFTTCAFVSRGHERLLITGGRLGELRLFEPTTGELLELYESENGDPVTCLQSQHFDSNAASGLGACNLFTSSTRAEVRVWDVEKMEPGPVYVFEGCRNGHFSNNGRQLAATTPAQREVTIFDMVSGASLRKLEDMPLGSTPRRSAAHLEARWNPCDSLLLWGGLLWDLRIPQPVHRFDMLSDGGGCFHPFGNEVIMNSEVWDLRTYKLLRSVPLLDGTTLRFSCDSSVMYASLARGSGEDPSTIVSAPRRARHPLNAAFRTLLSHDYTEIATMQVERCVLDLALEPSDTHIALVEMDSVEDLDSAVRIYEVGRVRPRDDDSDAGEDDEGGPSEGDSEDEDDDDDDDDNATSLSINDSPTSSRDNAMVHELRREANRALRHGTRSPTGMGRAARPNENVGAVDPSAASGDGDNASHPTRQSSRGTRRRGQLNDTEMDQLIGGLRSGSAEDTEEDEEEIDLDSNDDISAILSGLSSGMDDSFDSDSNEDGPSGSEESYDTGEDGVGWSEDYSS
mmetsp:Transcript_28173/g.53657  ORF Transcript_28173/g.53657 Transcript_28173/m.53657 type:complete len:597 (+) Transcript_28173:1-1791(+)